MVQHTGTLDLDEQGQYDFHGHSSGMVFLQRLRQQFGDLMGEAEGHGSPLAKPRHFTPMSQVLDSPQSIESPTDASSSPMMDLPPKAVARQHCEAALDDAFALMRFIHRPTFFSVFDQIYEVPAEAWGNEEHRYLPLLYALMSTGTMFAKDEKSQLSTEGYGSMAEQGYTPPLLYYFPLFQAPDRIFDHGVSIRANNFEKLMFISYLM